MASYLTNIVPDRQYQSTVPLEAIAFSLQSRQKRYDHEYAKLENFYANLSSIDLAKVEDQEYFSNNLKAVKQKVDAMGTGDLSVTGAGEVMSYIGQAADDAVVNGYIGTKKIRSIQQQAEEAKENGTYSDLNYSFSMRDANEWLNDGTAGTKYKGNTEYVPYTDITKIAREAIKEIVPNSYVKMDKMGSFSYYKETGEKITDSQITSMLDATVLSNPNVQTQLKVNAWGSYGNIDDNTFVNQYKQNVSNYIDKYDKNIQELNRLLATETNDENRKNLEQSKEILSNKKKQYEKIFSLGDEDVLNNRDNIQTQLYTENFLNSLKEAFTYDRVKDINIVTDQSSLEVWKQGNIQKRHEDEMSLKMKQNNIENYDKIYSAFYKDKNPAYAKALAQSSGVNFSEIVGLSSESTTEPIVLEKEERATYLDDKLNGSIDGSIIRKREIAQKMLKEQFDDSTLMTMGLLDNNGSINFDLEDDEGNNVVDSFITSNIANNLSNKEGGTLKENTFDLYSQYKEVDKKLKFYINKKKQRDDMVQPYVQKGWENLLIEQGIEQRIERIGRIKDTDSQGQLIWESSGTFTDPYNNSRTAKITRTPDGKYTITVQKSRASIDREAKSFESKDNLMNYIKNEFISYPSEYYDITDKLYQDVVGNSLTGVSYTVSQDNISNNTIVADVIRQIYPSLIRENPEYKKYEDYTSVENIEEALKLKKTTKSGEVTITGQQSFNKLPTVSFRDDQTIVLEGIGKPLTFDISMLDKNSVAYNQIEPIVRNAQFKAETIEEANFIFDKMKMKNETTYEDKLPYNIPTDIGTFKVNDNKKFRLNGGVIPNDVSFSTNLTFLPSKNSSLPQLNIDVSEKEVLGIINYYVGQDVFQSINEEQNPAVRAEMIRQSLKSAFKNKNLLYNILESEIQTNN